MHNDMGSDADGSIRSSVAPVAAANRRAAIMFEKVELPSDDDTSPASDVSILTLYNQLMVDKAETAKIVAEAASARRECEMYEARLVLVSEAAKAYTDAEVARAMMQAERSFSIEKERLREEHKSDILAAEARMQEKLKEAVDSTSIERFKSMYDQMSQFHLDAVKRQNEIMDQFKIRETALQQDIQDARTEAATWKSAAARLSRDIDHHRRTCRGTSDGSSCCVM